MNRKVVLLIFALLLSLSSSFVISAKRGAQNRLFAQSPKQDLLLAISSLRKAGGAGDGKQAKRARIITAIERLEAVQSKETIAKGKLDGRWSLVYSTRIDKNAYGSSSSSSSSDVVDLLTGNLYKLFFRFAPFLAGSSGSSSSSSSSSIDISSNNQGEEEEEEEASAPFIAANEQIIDLQQASIVNTVRIRIKGVEKRPVVITVKGLVKVKEEEEEEEEEKKNKAVISSSSTNLEVIFTSFDVNGLSIPLPRPKGTLTTTFIDEDLRIGRGGRGGVFVVKRF